MKKLYSCLLLLLFASLTTFASQNRKVLIIGIDGTRSDALQQANTPNIDGLLANATYTYDSWHTGITISGPSWSTILTGVNWNKHGVTDNSFNGSNFAQWPALPTLAKQIKPSLNCAIVAEWAPLIDDITNAAWNRTVKVTDGSNWPTGDSAAIELQNPDLDLLFAYFDKVDLTGHTSTFSPQNPLYINAIQDVDSAVGKILNALYARPTYASEDWLILVITDHGGILFGHGGNTNEERHIWWIASGSAVAHQQISQADPGTYTCHGTTFDSTCVNYSLMRESPVQADITVTALHHLIYDSGINPETKADWHLDGKSWLLAPNAVNELTAEEQMKVFPNPAVGEITVSGLSFQQPLPVEIFSVDGKKVFSAVTSSAAMQIKTSGLESGMYLLKCGNVVKKIEVLN